MAKGRTYQASLKIDPALAAAKSGRAYQALLTLPSNAPVRRGRLYWANLTTPAGGDGLRARLYQAELAMPTAAGQAPPSGIWAVRNGNLGPCALRAAVNGQN